MKPTTRKQSAVIYSINVEDVESVAEKEFSTTLTNAEIKEIENSLGDHIDWYSSLASVIGSVINKRSRRREKTPKPTRKSTLHK